MLCTVRTWIIGWVLCPEAWLRLALLRGLREPVYLGVLCLFTDRLCFQLSEAEPGSFGKVWPFHSPVTFRKGFSLPESQRQMDFLVRGCVHLHGATLWL